VAEVVLTGRLMIRQRIERSREQIAALQERVGRFDILAGTLQELPKKLSHPVMVRSVGGEQCRVPALTRDESLQVPLGKRAMVPGKIVRSNEVLAHLGDDYYAWRTVPSAVEMIGRKKKGETPPVRRRRFSTAGRLTSLRSTSQTCSRASERKRRR